MSRAKVQHYVPQFLLRHFCDPCIKKHKVHVFDKLARESFPTNPRNIACESRFYDYESGGQIHSIEEKLGALETATRPIIAEIVRAKSLPRYELCPEEMTVLAMFVAAQISRTRWTRDRMAEIPRRLADFLRAQRDLDIDHLVPDMDENEEKKAANDFVVDWTKRAAPMLLGKTWVLFTTTQRAPFLIGDHPVAVDNRQPARLPFASNRGIASVGAEIHLPLSSTVSLAMLCPTVAQEVIGIKAFAEAFDTGVAIRLQPDHVTYLNSLQISYAERYVISSISDFRLVLELIDRNPDFATGPRFEFA